MRMILKEEAKAVNVRQRIRKYRSSLELQFSETVGYTPSNWANSVIIKNKIFQVRVIDEVESFAIDLRNFEVATELS